MKGGRVPKEAPGRRRVSAGGPARGWRILLVGDVYPPRCGGSGWSTHALALALAQRGHRVEVAVVDPGGFGLTQRIYQGIPVMQVGVRAARWNPRRRLGRRDYAHRRLTEYLTARLRRSDEIDLLHGQHLHSGPPTVEAARRFGKGVVLTLRDYWPVCLHGTVWWGGRECPGCTTDNLVGCMGEYWAWPRPLARWMVPWARRRLGARRLGVSGAHRILAVSEAVRGRVAREVNGAEVAVVPNLVDPDATMAEAEGQPPPEVEGPYLVAAGKLVRTKGFHRLLDLLERTGCPWTLVVAGEGPLRGELEELARRSALPVRFLGWVDHGPLMRLLRDAWATLLPSAWNEPLSRLILESMAVGTPVIAWARGGSVEAVEHGHTGWLVSGAEDLAAALQELADPEVRRRVGNAALATARRRFSPDAVYPQVAAVYAAALEAAGRARGGAA